jgi:hypothetical protein
MDWQLAIEKNREALLRIIAGLYAFAGLAEGAVAAVLPRLVYRAILLVLRPAESAVRRLIIIAACGLVVSPRASRGAPAGLAPHTGTARLPAFTLIDPLKRFAPFSGRIEDWGDDDEEEDADDGDWSASLPRISVPGFFDPVFVVPAVPCPHDLINATQLLRRLHALARALETLPKQARRLARWHARRELMRKQCPLRTGRMSPFRPGAPPGNRLRHTHEVHGILRECHLLMLDKLAMDVPDTS